MKDIDFAALLCSRLCHDLVSPVGAMSNGIEILADEDDEDMRDEVVKLLEQSARQTSNRLKFFRLAFGAGGGFGEMVGLHDSAQTVQSYFEESKITLVWTPQVSHIRKDVLKALLNLILVAGEAIIRAGQLTVEARSDGGKLHVEVRAEAEKLNMSDKMIAVLRGDEAVEIDSKTAPAYLARNVADAIGATIEVDDQTPMTRAIRFSVAEA